MDPITANDILKELRNIADQLAIANTLQAAVITMEYGDEKEATALLHEISDSVGPIRRDRS